MSRILLLGLGAFDRAHQAVYLQRLHDRGAKAPTRSRGPPFSAFCNDPALWGPLAGSSEMIEAIRWADREVTAFVTDSLVG